MDKPPVPPETKPVEPDRETVEGWPVQWPRGDGLAVLLLAGHLLFPVAVGVIGLLADTPTGAAVDWAGVSGPARALDALLVGHLGYTLGLLAAMRGRRAVAGVVGVVALGVSAAVNMGAWLAVTGVYL